MLRRALSCEAYTTSSCCRLGLHNC